MEATKITPLLAAEIRTRSPREEIPIIVKYREGVMTVKALAPGMMPIYHYRLVPGAAMRVRAESIAALDRDPRVERVWLDLPVHTCLDVSVPLIGAPRVWDAGFTGRGIVIAIVDTGIDIEHPDLAGRVVETVDFSGEGFVDNNGHGTHVAGIAAGNGAASEGKYRGVAPEATLIAAKVLKGDGSGMMSDVMAGVEWAVEHGTQVINLSLGARGPCDGTDALSETCDAAVDKGVVVCVAAGNDGPSPSTVGPPGCARKVITVGASTDEDKVADFSSRGPTRDGRIKPDIVLPGHNIISCRARAPSPPKGCLPAVLRFAYRRQRGEDVLPGDYYTQLSGTSMATPHAAGSAVLLLEAEPGLKPAQIKEVLMQTAKDLGLDPNTQGAGRADIYQAYSDALSRPSI